MMMHAEDLATIANAAARLRAAADAGSESPRIARFVVDGHALLAIAYSLSGDRTVEQQPASDDRPLVGQITCAGIRYLVYDVDTEMAAKRNATPSAVDVLTRKDSDSKNRAVFGLRHPVAQMAQPVYSICHSAAFTSSSVPRKPPDWRFQ